MASSCRWGRDKIQFGEAYKLADTDQLVTAQNADPHAAGDGYKVVGARRTHCDRAKRIDLIQAAVVLKLRDLGGGLKAAGKHLAHVHFCNSLRGPLTVVVAIGVDDQGIQHGLHVPLDLALYHLNVTRPQVFCDVGVRRKRHGGIEEAFTNCLRWTHQNSLPDALPFSAKH